MSVKQEKFGTMPDRRAVDAFVFRNAGGMTARIITLGGAIQSLMAADRDGQFADVILGFPGLEGYLSDTSHQGALIGRFANRIAGGRFPLDGKTVQASQNRGEDTLHGGKIGFDDAIWEAEIDGARLVLKHHSPDGDQGFPGDMDVTATYALSDDGVLSIAYEATTDAPTVINLTNHAYWDLAGRGDILDHTLQLNADAFTPVNERTMPTGEIKPVAGTPFDFRKTTPLRERVMDTSDPQIALGKGIDHNFVLNGRGMRRAGTVADETSGRSMEVSTDQPGMQVYTGNNLGKGAIGKHGAPYPRFGGIALETQHYPNSPNEPSFPSTVLRPGDVFRSETRFHFKTLPR